MTHLAVAVAEHAEKILRDGTVKYISFGHSWSPQGPFYATLCSSTGEITTRHATSVTLAIYDVMNGTPPVPALPGLEPMPKLPGLE